MKNLGKQTKESADGFAVLMNPKTTLTPHLCRKGCKHYDPVGDPKAADFNEYCKRGLKGVNLIVYTTCQ